MLVHENKFIILTQVQLDNIQMMISVININMCVLFSRYIIIVQD